MQPDYPAEIVCVVSNRPEARRAVQGGRRGHAGARHRSQAASPSATAFEAELDAALRAFDVDLVACAGFMRLMTPAFVERWRDRMLNIHPSLLPAFKGLDTHARALAAGVKLTGCTVHVVRPEVDSGPIVAQAAVPVLDGDTPETPRRPRAGGRAPALSPCTFAFCLRGDNRCGRTRTSSGKPRLTKQNHCFGRRSTEPDSVAADQRPSAKMKRKRVVAWTLAAAGWYLFSMPCGGAGTAVPGVDVGALPRTQFTTRWLD